MLTTTSLIQIGSRVRLQEPDGEAEFTIVGREDSDVVAGLLCDESPLGRALLGRAPGDRVDIRAPGGLRSVTVIEVD
jgi:transcription elongation GreA/GreB family factor